MAKSRNEATTREVKHRAVCEDDRFRGPWRDTRAEAIEDAANHRNKPGNQDHVINIISQQTEIRAFNLRMAANANKSARVKKKGT